MLNKKIDCGYCGPYCEYFHRCEEQNFCLKILNDKEEEKIRIEKLQIKTGK